MIGEGRLYYEIVGLQGHQVVARLRGWSADQLSMLFMPLAEKIDNF